MADPDFAEWFEVAGIATVPVMLDGRPKLLAQALADPALLAIEPGLEPVSSIVHRDHNRCVEAQR
jgi:hypothetical protein